MKRLVLLASLSLAACGGTITDLDGGVDSSTDAPTDGGGCSKCIDAAPYACGKSFCSGASSVCVHPCCGGGPMLCAPLGDGGVCGPGLVLSQQCPSNMPCTEPPCTPPEPYCGTTTDCSNPQSGHDCYLLCQ